MNEQSYIRGSGECGAKGSIFKPPHAVFFNASCDLHDLSYYIGGNEADRLKADLGFLRAMLNDCDRIKNNIIKKAYYTTWAYLYYFAVRNFGSKYFEYYD